MAKPHTPTSDIIIHMERDRRNKRLSVTPSSNDNTCTQGMKIILSSLTPPSSYVYSCYLIYGCIWLSFPMSFLWEPGEEGLLSHGVFLYAVLLWNCKLTRLLLVSILVSKPCLFAFMCTIHARSFVCCHLQNCFWRKHMIVWLLRGIFHIWGIYFIPCALWYLLYWPSLLYFLSYGYPGLSPSLCLFDSLSLCVLKVVCMCK